MRDGTLYSESDDLANGAGQHLLAGTTGGGARRRALVAFDLGAVPPGSTVTGATLALFMSRTIAPAGTVALHRVVADWGEGTSDAPLEEGAGAPATPGDATWGHRFHETVSWSVPGGDFLPAPSSTAVVGGNGFYAWTSSALTNDVQAWVDGEPNHGWIVIGDEAVSTTAKRFDSRENPVAGQRPRLTVQFLSAGSTTTTSTVTTTTFSTTSTTTPLVLEPFVDPLPRPAVAQPGSGVPGGAATYRIAIREIAQQLHRDLPPTTVWGFGDGPTGATYPGPTIEAVRDAPVTVAWVNDLRDVTTGVLRTEHILPVDTCLHGAHDASPRTVVHLHGGHVPAAFDGYPEATLLPGEETTYVYPNAQPASTLWYHDHAIGITRLNVYMGLAGFYLLRDAEEAALGLPAGEFEIPLAIQDRRFRADGALDYPAVWEEHFFGDTILVNGKVWPYLEVTPGKYRFRIVSGSTSRTYRLALSTGAPFAVIGTESGLLSAPVPVTSLTLGSGERADVVVDFAGHAPGTTLRLVNDAPAPFPGTPGAGVIPDVLEFRVVAGPAHTAPLPETLRPLERLDEATAVTTREFELRKASHPCTGAAWLINGLGWDAITERPQLGTTEVWSFVNRSGIMHPMHLHLVFFQVLDRQAFEVQDGVVVPIGPRVPPPPEEAGWKDTVRVGPNEILRLVTRFETYKGRYPYHCHILEHEDHEMMRQFETVLCGDAELDPGEDCDDGNRLDGDGCSAVCASEGTSTSTTLGTSTTAAPSTSTTTSTTTTTVPVEELLLSGAKLRLQDRPGKPQKRRLRIVSKDGARLPAVAVPTGAAVLRVLAVGGDGFAGEYALAATGWAPLAKKNPGKGLRYQSRDGAIREIVLATGEKMTIRGKGEALAQTLGTEPDRVRVELRLGLQRYCLEFGGESDFRPDRTLDRRDAPRPVACP